MAKGTKYAGFAEERTRISIFLPAAKPGHFKSLADIYRYVQQQRRAKKARVSGYTKTVNPSPYTGAWWGKEPSDPKGAPERWVFEGVSQLILDLEGGEADCEKLLKRLHRKILNVYRSYKCPQADLWIMSHRGMRFDSEYRSKRDNR